jgi:uncharacterized protein (TIGR02246 family)
MAKLKKAYRTQYRPTFTPLVQAFLRAFNAGDIDALVALYEPQAVLVAQSGQVAQGHAAVREGFDAFLSLKPTLNLLSVSR